MKRKATISIDERRMYGDLAWTWPIISPPEDYIEESEWFANIIKNYSKIPVKMLLHLGCGGGHNDHTLKKYFEITSVDVSEEMLKLARNLNPDVTYLHGDMRTIRLEKYFDAVIIFDSINYMTTIEDLRAAFSTAFLHLKPGGIFLTYAEETKEEFEQNKTVMSKKKKDDIEIILVDNSYDPNQSDTSFESTFVYLIRQGKKLKVEVDRHVLGLFSLNDWIKLLEEFKFEVKHMKFRFSNMKEDEYDSNFVCIKPSR